MKKLLFTLCLVGGYLTASAQLFVRPNPTTSTDSYIYVNDQVLYVDDEVNLEINTNNAATEASIYLRGDGQLIQGNTGAGANEGDGLLSVYQQGFADRYEYNYWASPVGNASASVGNENFGITKFYDVVNVTQSTQALNTPGFDGSSSPLTISTRWIWRYITGTTYSDWIYVGNTQTIGPGQGFTMKGVDFGAGVGSTPQQEYDFRGKPNSGDITNSVADDQLTLIGNPYPSAVDLQEFFDGNPDVDAEAFYWEQDHSVNSHYLNAYEGGYGVWQADGSIDGDYMPAIFLNYGGDGSTGPPTGSAGTVIERRYAPIGQGFMVRGDVNGTVTMRDEYREFVAEGAGNFSEFKSGSFGNSTVLNDEVEEEETEEEVILDYPYIMVNTFINENFSAPLKLKFYDKATLGKDRGKDTKNIRAWGNDVYFSLLEDPENEEYIIQTVPFDKELMLPLSFKVAENSVFRMYIEDKYNFNQTMYLFDSETNTYQTFSKEQYLVQELTPGTYEGRFFITFAKADNPADAATAAVEAKVQVFQNNPAKQLEVLNDELLMLDTATLYDINGRLLWSRNDLGNDSRYSYPTGLLADGIYILRLQTADGAIKVEKISVFNK